ncbi:MAG: RluA family pseudouridine synthase [Peptococcaceae bacterium]|jgi:23S rRNA pseudouridine1911/1915/1917 synthase|nr:RluA family pseudouridine synthase [Peptococcaceae bacterium]
MPSPIWRYTLQAADHGQKIADLLYQKFHFSRKLIQNLKQGENAWLDGQFTFLNVRGQAGQILTLQLERAEEANLTPEYAPIQIIYEDDDLLAVNKPAGVVVHPTPLHPEGTLGNAVLGYWLAQGLSRRFRPVHRIDRNTSGVILIAKNQFAHQQVDWQQKHGYIGKTYCGFISGRLDPRQGEINQPIRLVPDSFIQRQIHPDGKPAVTDYRTLRLYPNASLLLFTLKTGRTHQIRTHCQGIGHPLLGDDLYGGDTKLIGRQALHSLSYTLQHPRSGQSLTLRAPFPDDLRRLARRLKQL